MSSDVSQKSGKGKVKARRICFTRIRREGRGIMRGMAGVGSRGRIGIGKWRYVEMDVR